MIVSPSAAASFFLRHRHALRPPILESDLDGKHAGSRLLEHMHSAFLGRNDAKFGQQEPRSNYGVPGQFQLFFCREDPQSRQRSVFAWLLYEDGL